MKLIRGIELYTGSREELLPGFARDLPYIATRAELDAYLVPWHWHKTVEIFYVESGSLEYHTPAGRTVFGAGSGGMVNRDVLHMTKALSRTQKNIQLLHIFDLSLLGGEPGSRIEQRYVTPLAAARQVELIPLFPGSAAQDAILQRVLRAFDLDSEEFGYEVKLREALTEIWLMLFRLARPMLSSRALPDKSSGAIKTMLAYIHEHYAEKLTVGQIAQAAYLSERECYRVFGSCLHTSPAEYLKTFRLQAAQRMLAREGGSVTEISHACGLGASSYFGKLFKEYTGCTPSEYRSRWQDRDI